MTGLRKRSRKTHSESEYSGSDLALESDENAEEESDDVWTPVRSKAKSKRAKKRPPKKPKVKPPLPSKATVSILAQTPEDKIVTDDLAHVDRSVIARIVKALNLANHSGTGEQEARAALRMAQKLMSQHSVTQAAVLSTMDDKAEKLRQTGMSTVTIKGLPEKVLNMSAWSETAASAMDVFFNCKSYTTSFSPRDRIDFCFYGLAEQTVAAAYAFEMVYNLIVTWRAENKEAKGTNAKNSYCRGVADGLLRLAHKEQRQEESEAKAKEQNRLESAKKREEAERLRQVARLEGPKEEEEVNPKVEEVAMDETIDRKPKVEEIDDIDMLRSQIHVKTEPMKEEQASLPFSSRRNSETPPVSERVHDGSENDDDGGCGSHFEDPEENVHADFHDSDPDDDLLDLDAAEPKLKIEVKEETVPVAIPSAPAPTIMKKDPGEEESPWESAGQLVAFRETASGLADDYLKSTGVKLGAGRRMATLEFKDSNAKRVYRKGWEDAKKIDVKRRRITETEGEDVY